MPVTPRMVELANQFRAALLRRERMASTAMVRHYGSIWQSLQREIRQVMDEAADLDDPDTIVRLERLRALRNQTASELARFVEFADSTISGGVREAIAAGERDSYQLILAGFPPGAELGASLAALPREAVEALVGVLQDGSPLRDVIAGYVGDAEQRFADTLVEGLAQGWHARKMAYQLRSAFGMGLTKAMQISRTEMLRAYRTATLHQYQQSEITVGWERCAVHDRRVCPACLMLDGKRYKLDEPMDDHVNGRCFQLAITKSWRELGIDQDEPEFQRELGGDWLRSQPDDVQQDVLGMGRWQAWKDGKFKLEDLPKRIRSDVWGDSWVPKSLKELVSEEVEMRQAA